jgi:hypothetical protein
MDSFGQEDPPCFWEKKCFMIRALGFTCSVGGLALSALSAAEPDVPKDVAVSDGHKMVASAKAKSVQVYKAVERNPTGRRTERDDCTTGCLALGRWLVTRESSCPGCRERVKWVERPE